MKGILGTGIAIAGVAGFLAACLMFAAVGCSDRATDFGKGGPPVDTGKVFRPFDPAKPADTLRVATFNMSIGFPVAQLLFTQMDDDTVAYKALDTLHTRFQRGLPADRLKAMARAIIDRDLDVVALQEVETISRDGGAPVDFITGLLAEIQAAGGPAYRHHKLVLNDTTLAGALGGKTISVRFSEGNAMLVKSTFQWLDSADLIYYSLLPLNVDTQAKSQRALCYARLRSPKGVLYQVYHSHLEVISIYAQGQAGEMLKVIDSLKQPWHTQIFLGDLNSKPGEDAHRLMTVGGFWDSHDSIPGGGGATCCVANSELWNPKAGFSERRLDYIMVKRLVKVLAAGTALEAPIPASNGIDTVFASDHRMVTATLLAQ